MSRTNRKKPGARRNPQPRRITVRSTRRTPPDLRKLSRALLDLAAAQAEADAQASAARADDTASDFGEHGRPSGDAA